MRSLIAALMLCATMVSALAEWKPEYAQASPEVREWYRNAPLTEEAQKRYPFKKCCDHADVVRTKFQVNKVDGRDEWFYEPLDALGTLKRIPDDIIHWGVSAPGGQPTLFVYSGKETCFFPGDGGDLMRWLLLFPGISLMTASVMLYLAFCDILNDCRRRRPRWKLRHSLDAIALSVGFICMIVTSLYVLIMAVILW